MISFVKGSLAFVGRLASFTILKFEFLVERLLLVVNPNKDWLFEDSFVIERGQFEPPLFIFQEKLI